MKNALSFLVLLVMASSGYSQSGLFAKRLAKLPSTIPFTANDFVDEAIQNLVRNDSNSTSKLLGWSALLTPMIEDSLKAYKLPVELKYLPAAMSRYDQWKVSDDGGSGIWQMRYLTAKEYGLHLSSYVDERRDEKRATSAALRHLTDLKRLYTDWRLIMVAFYSGEVEVNKAIRKAGTTDYWKVHEVLPVRYQSIVPNFIASVYIHHYATDHSIKTIKIERIGVESVPITQWTTIFQMSRALEVNFDSLKNLNPIYKKQVIPHTERTYYLNVPFEKVGRFYSLGDSVYTYQVLSKKDSANEPKPSLEMDRPTTQEPEMSPAPSTSTQKVLYYTVKKGDYLGKIADLYDVRISDVRRWNNIRGDQINVNQRIKIYVSASDYDKYSKINGMSGYQKDQLIRKD
ncbi:MAG: LysM peptidoglycan-binding domain-containing protein [Bacteroidetes bacterium]|nr:LysM peptidoglycan-binding domain-containing protein [Bacteroidota bacterium]